CPDCRKLVSELSSVVDDLLLLAPAQEPPPGFAARTLARMSPPAARPRPAARRGGRQRWTGHRWLPRLAVAASIVAALAVGAGAVYQGTASDRRLADSYRSVLNQGHGSFFAAAALRGQAGTLGTVYGYQGNPSWLFATVHMPGSGAQRYHVQLITRDGQRLAAGSAVLGGHRSTWGAQIPMDLAKLAQLRFIAPDGKTAMVAYFTARSPWGSG
ncbi:MAG: hypothetical protein LBI49_08210, partial [Nocardiopsaceae bacterium]|nr:hypothetical protein [Nocardiopsaceae bacterium]